ncbi:hypothetical protein [Inhella proteolytica]|uniref:DUF4124 domain-containing protein n=1 Tax=Inhella proteolytica TaxID=2795029 RepID=A0A931NJG8_9BURK|nr:hypothetical protein [Inhella proteolytica]MBH9579004.1 hypothetical protein [Inhella proteolytica]
MTLRRRPLLLLPLLPLLLTSLSGLAQTRRQSGPPIFRCGPGGRELRDRPCPAESGASAPLSYDQPSQSDRAAALQRQAAEAREAARLQRERERFEASAPPASQPAGSQGVNKAPADTRGTPPERPDRPARNKPRKDEKTRTARSPAIKR